jgi:hypothetical protein
MDARPLGIVGWIAIRARAVVAGAVLIEILALSPTLAEAGVIRSHALRVPKAGQSTAEFFQEALNNHWLRVDIPARMRHLHADAIGLLPNTVFVQYLEWRHSLNPVRFDQVHPNIGPMIEHDLIVRAALNPPPIVGPFTLPVVGVQTLNPPPGTGPVVPEPGTLTIALVMIGSAAFARRRARRHA